jgi:hypothetical protein
MLRDKVKQVTSSKRRGNPSQYVVLLHDNAQPVIAHTAETLQQLLPGR